MRALQRGDRPRRAAPSRPAAGCTSACSRCPPRASLDGLPIATVEAAGAAEPLEGYTFEGYRNADGSVGTRNILAITHDGAVRGGRGRFRGASASRPSCCRSIRTSTTWSALEHTYGCGVAIDAPDAIIPIRTLRNITLNPNFGNEVMVVSLGCEKLQPERLLPPGHLPDRRRAQRGRRRRDDEARLDVVVPAGRRARRLHVDDRLDHGHRRGAPRAPERAPARDRARRASWWSACSAAAAMRSAASPPIRRWASAPTCWCAPARP